LDAPLFYQQRHWWRQRDVKVMLRSTVKRDNVAWKLSETGV